MEKETAEKIDGGETMAEMWEGFAEAVIPFSQAGTVQYREMQKAFYSGAFCLFNWIMVQMDPGIEPTDADLARVDRMDAELTAFFNKVTGRQPQ